MNPLAKLAGFAVVLALVFAGAAFAGSRLDVHPGRAAADKPAHMGGMTAATMPVRGLAVSEHGLTLQLPRRTDRNSSSADVSPAPRGTRICGGIDREEP